jgi:hypothetical protein
MWCLYSLLTNSHHQSEQICLLPYAPQFHSFVLFLDFAHGAEKGKIKEERGYELPLKQPVVNCKASDKFRLMQALLVS